MARLDGRRALVTGASSGIGAATARAIAEAGGHVALLARRAEPLEELAAELDGVAVPADVTDPDAARQAVDSAADRLGGLDGVVNGAGIFHPGGVADTTPDDWRAMFEVNCLGLLHVTQPAIAHLRAADRGDVVNVSSMSGRRVPSPTGGVYSGTKFAVHAISEGLRQELQPDGIRVSIVAPGFVRTDIFADPRDDTERRYRQQMTEHGMAPETVATAIVDLLALPPDAAIVEVAILPTAQTRSG